MSIKLFSFGSFSAINDISHQLPTCRINVITTSFTNGDGMLILHQGFLETVDA
ncbi:Uncharacterised protein [Vibrio cholerae]|nr:Uncharacterised protein [Vibrio cholerae]CSB59204.1 Uncharacterised protein [Vibrio cholerae]